MEIQQSIQEEIRQRARSYTPEWRFDTENPDIGSALALVFAEMTARTIRQLSKIPQKNRIAFFNGLDTEILPALPAQGYVQFSLINEEVPGVTVETGTIVSASAPELPEGQMDFETCEDVYVTPAVLSDIYQTCDMQDSIFRIYDRQIMQWNAFSLFSPEHTNLQKHEMYISHDVVLQIQADAFVSLTCFTQGNRPLAPMYYAALADTENAVIEYHSEKGWIPFTSMQAQEEQLVFHKTKDQPGFAKIQVGGSESHWIRLRILKYSVFSGMYLARMELSAWSRGEAPDIIFGIQGECNLHRFLPFGEQLTPYQEVYFGSEEIFSKKGAQITLSFGIHFMKIPLNIYEKQTWNWEWIMDREKMGQEIEYDVTIENVLWEYYNGSGWTRLFTDEKYSQVFSVPDGEQEHYRKISFICPDDMEKTLVNAKETYYVRARIMKINNLYKLTGNYVVPVLENTSLQYQYHRKKAEPQTYVFHNNMEYTSLQGGRIGNSPEFQPFAQTGEEGMAMYLGFEAAPVGGPIKMLFCVGDDLDCSRQSVLWEYWNGTHWKNLHPVDETEHFSKTGIVTFSGRGDMKKKGLFGKERYWLRILDLEQVYTVQEILSNRPVIYDMRMNTVPVRHIFSRQEQKKSEGGTCGNLPAGTTWRMERSIGYIHEVANPEAMTGGCEAETPEDAMERMAASIRHQNRAVSVKDYEQLAMCAVRGLRMVKCFSGYDDTGKLLKGAVTLVVLPEQYGRESIRFAPVKEKIMQYMKDKVSSSLTDSGKLFVIHPEIIEIRLFIECTVENLSQIFRIKEEILQRLERFFCPRDVHTGRGWEIGNFPSMMQIQNAINEITGIVYIRNMRMSACRAGTGEMEEVDVETVQTHKYILPVNGEHEIIVNV